VTIAQVLQCQEKQIIESKYNTSLLYTAHNANVVEYQEERWEEFISKAGAMEDNFFSF